MAQGVVRGRFCQWDPAQDRRHQSGGHHLAAARFVVYQDDGSQLELCEDCAELPKFDRAKKHRLPTC